MRLNHPLDHPAWSALTTRQAHLAIIDGPARRFDPAYAFFAGVEPGAADGDAALARLADRVGSVGLFEIGEARGPAGLVEIDHISCLQMICAQLQGGGRAFEVEPLTDADGPEMLALATLTKPGPFLEKTHLLGPFTGVREAGRLIAMAGERLTLDGFSEVSGVCTHPDHRGQGLAGALMRLKTEAILARGDTAFLHVRAAHAETIAFYHTLGFEPRVEVTYRVLAPAA